MDLNSYTSKIIREFIETEEDFIFQTISPFCNEITQRTISKKELIGALAHYRDLEKENQSLKNKLYSIELALEALQDKIRFE